jgi:hypothetical protein
LITIPTVGISSSAINYLANLINAGETQATLFTANTKFLDNDLYTLSNDYPFNSLKHFGIKNFKFILT